MEKEFRKIADVAKMFGVTRQTIRNWIGKGIFKTISIDGQTYVNISGLKKFESKLTDITVTEGAIDAYQKSLNVLEEEYRKQVQELRSAIPENKLLGKNRYIIARFIPVVWGMLNEGLPTTKRGDFILQRLVEGEDVKFIANELGLTFERVRQIIEKELRTIRQYAPRYAALRCENERLADEVAKLSINIKSYENMEYEVKETNTTSNILTKDLVDCNLSVRAINYCRFGDIKTVSDLVSHSKTDLLKLRCIGKKTLMELDDLVHELGLEWGKHYIIGDDGKVVEVITTT